MQYVKKESEDFVDYKMFKSSDELQSLTDDDGINTPPDIVSDGIHPTVCKWTNKVCSFTTAVAPGSQKFVSSDTADEEKTKSEDTVTEDTDKDGK